MTTFSGKGVYGAIAIGKLSIFKRQEVTVKRRHITDVEAEKARVTAAKERATNQLQAIYEKALKEVGETNAQIFEIHMMMLEDEDYNEAKKNISGDTGRSFIADKRCRRQCAGCCNKWK